MLYSILSRGYRGPRGRRGSQEAKTTHPLMTADPRTIGQHIAALRRANGWSQRRLADAAGVSHGYIGLLERGQLPNPGKRRLDAVARALRLPTADALLDGQFDDAWEQDLVKTFGTTIRPASSANVGSASNLGPLGNVAGVVEQLRAASARPLPVFQWGSCGDPRDRDSPPDPDHLEYPPPGRETLIGPAGFGVVVKGESMAGRGIHDGDTVWVNPDRPYAVGKVVLALASDVGGETGMVVKTYARTDVGDCLVSETAQGRSTLVCREFKIIGPVVGITSWRLPS
jgi:SOS-response transcriptional repressor LexA